MTQEQIIEGDKLIAEFDEKINLELEFGEWYLENPNELKYNSSWDWLMPVVIKLKNIVHEKENFLKMAGRFMNVQEALLKMDITVLYLAVVEFINWYNLNKKE